MYYWKMSESNDGIKYFVIRDDLIGEIKVDKHNINQIAKIREASLIKSLPISYIQYVEAENSNSILSVIHGKDSRMHYKFDDTNQRREVLNEFASFGTVKDITVGKDSILTLIKKPMIALLVLLLVFGWSYATAIEIESGQARGEHIVIILLIAGLGTTYIPIIFGLLLCIVICRLYFVLSRRDSITRVYFKDS